MKILQFGEGNFLRCFFDWMLQKMAEATGDPFEVIMVQPRDRGDGGSGGNGDRAEAIAAAGKYHVLLRGFVGDTYREEVDTVRVVRAGVNPYRDQERYLALGMDPEIGVITSNTTEAGLFYEAGHSAPHNVPSLLALLLNRRAEAALAPVALLPLELLDRNGDSLKDCLCAYGRDFGYGKTYTDYLNACPVYNSLVDRIVPGFPEDAAERLQREYGADPYLTSGEWFHLFVIEGDPAILERLPFDKAGLNVVVTQDALDFYHDRKVRVLNGAHTASAPFALFAGLEEVNRFVDDEYWGDWIRGLMHEEIVFALNDAVATHAYADEVLRRFRNPALRHSFRSIALNSVAKTNTRLRSSLEAYWQKTGTLPPRISAALCKMIELYSVRDGVQRALPGGEMKLSDFSDLKGAATPPEILDRLLPALNPALREALLRFQAETRA